MAGEEEIMKTVGEQMLECLNKVKDPNPELGSLPVLVKTSKGIRHLGFANTHDDAVLLGVMCRISCERVSRTQVIGDPRIFFMLRP
jgi:hypothetical protein